MLTYITTRAPGCSAFQARSWSASIESASEQPASRSGISTVFSGERIEAVSAMKWTPQKAITSASAAAAWRERPEAVAEVVGDVLDLGQLVVVGEDHRVALLGERPHLVAEIARISSGERSGAIVGWIVGNSCMWSLPFPMFAGPAEPASNQSNELTV